MGVCVCVRREEAYDGETVPKGGALCRKSTSVLRVKERNREEAVDCWPVVCGLDYSL